jgi:hypothetical protein
VVHVCDSGTSCVASVSESSAMPQSYVAAIGNTSGGNVQAQSSPPVTVTWRSTTNTGNRQGEVSGVGSCCSVGAEGLEPPTSAV